MRYINIHVLIAHSASCLNRDDMQMQKTAMVGGVRRTRVSSQCLKYWMRNSDYYQSKVGEKSIRTREYGEVKRSFLKTAQEKGQDIDERALEGVMDILCGSVAKPVVTRFSIYEVGKAYELFEEVPDEDKADCYRIIELGQLKNGNVEGESKKIGAEEKKK